MQFTSLQKQEGGGKEVNNLLLLLSHLYNFKVSPHAHTGRASKECVQCSCDLCAYHCGGHTACCSLLLVLCHA